MNNPRTVTAELDVGVHTPDAQAVIPLRATLSYSETDPFAVKVAFDVGLDEPVTWAFARDLLAQGLKGKTGQGDVTVRPETGGVLGVLLSSPFGDADFEFPAREVAAFTARTYDLVPENGGHEVADAEVDSFFLPGGLLHETGHSA